jgi:hypothetical protein
MGVEPSLCGENPEANDSPSYTMAVYGTVCMHYIPLSTYDTTVLV